MRKNAEQHNADFEECGENLLKQHLYLTRQLLKAHKDIHKLMRKNVARSNQLLKERRRLKKAQKESRQQKIGGGCQ